MPDIITLGIDAKHSNEDQIAPFDEWIKRYNGQIGLFGGFDVNLLSLGTYQSVYDEVLKKGTEYRRICKGYGLGSGNSIASYVSVDGFRGMIDAVKQIRRKEKYQIGFIYIAVGSHYPSSSDSKFEFITTR